MLEIDFHPVTATGGDGSTKSGDAISGRFLDATGKQRVFVVDGGYQATGEAVVAHIRKYYETSRVDLAISTHADADHINGMPVIVDELTVEELMLHQPRQRAGSAVAGLSNIEAVDTLLSTAEDNGTAVSDPFTGEERLGGHVQLMGPDKDFYDELLVEHLVAVALGTKSVSLANQFRSRARDLLESARAMLPMIETLSDICKTDPRNEMSVITLLAVDGYRILLTGDAGQRSLTRAADEYEARVGSFAANPLGLFQVPHHGSRHNIGPTLLNRIIGAKGASYAITNAIVSAAKDSPKHPSPKVTNALLRRDAVVAVTAGTTVCYQQNAVGRFGWYPATPLPPLDEGTDPDV